MFFVASINPRNGRLVVRNLDYIEDIAFSWPDSEEMTSAEFHQACWDSLVDTLQLLVLNSTDPIDHVLFVGTMVKGHTISRQWFAVDRANENDVDRIDSADLPEILDFGLDWYVH